ncbi:MAG: ATP-binding protein [Acidobacteria bacterium]|nr:ATP-binding protein [Acidobacteriota bacterium]
MNLRSIHFRLTAYQVSLMALILLVFAITSYYGFQRYLTHTLESQCSSQTKQIADSLLAGLPVSGADHVRDEIAEHYSPESNNTFIRIVSSNGAVLYESGMPHDGSFGPPRLGFLPNLRIPATEVSREAHRLVFVRPYQLANGDSYQIQMAASTLPLENSLEGLWRIGLFILPFALVSSSTGGFLLVRRSLQPIRTVIATAQRIHAGNLKERLTEQPTGDEIQQLARTLNQMFERLDASFRQMVRFTADASHELRTPLTVIRGNLELLLQFKPVADIELGSPDAKEIVAQTLEETEQLSKTVGQLLELAQMDSGEITLERETFDLAELTQTAAEQMSLLAEDKGIRLQTEPMSRLTFSGDRYRIKQVLLNLIDNAIKYCPSGSEIQLGLSKDAQNTVIKVRDNGPGIPGDALTHLYDRFYRIDKARSRELGGTGLGLSICKSICEAHGGRIEVESQIREGSTFRVLLPGSVDVASRV